MSLKTGYMLNRLRANGESHVSPIRCERHETVYETFCNYRVRCIGICNDRRKLKDLLFFEVFDSANQRGSALREKQQRCYAYLWSIRCETNTLYKVGITGNLHRRLVACQSAIPPVFRVKAEAILTFENSLDAEVCEWSVLASHVDLWVGGEWLREPRVIHAEGTDVR